MTNSTIAVVFGTRPEAVKMVPVIKALKTLDAMDTITISTGQHREMLKPILEQFEKAVDYEMDLMEPNQSLYRLSTFSLPGPQLFSPCTNLDHTTSNTCLRFSR
jgi:UDP-N-acetylglucosamine 2-epimerase (non-hydrolysing)